MDDLKKRFGTLVAAHRRRLSFTQQELAERASVSVDSISKIEIGATGASFQMIERLADVLGIDPAELFSTEVPSDLTRRRAYVSLTAKLAALSEKDLQWLSGVVEAALKRKP